MLRQLQHFPQDEEVLAFEAGCKEYCKREVDEVEWQGDRIYLHLGVRRDERGNARQSAGGPGGAPPRLDQAMLFEVGLEAASAQVDPPVKGAEARAQRTCP